MGSIVHSPVSLMDVVLCHCFGSFQVKPTTVSGHPWDHIQLSTYSVDMRKPTPDTMFPHLVSDLNVRKNLDKTTAIL